MSNSKKIFIGSVIAAVLIVNTAVLGIFLWKNKAVPTAETVKEVEIVKAEVKAPEPIKIITEVTGEIVFKSLNYPTLISDYCGVITEMAVIIPEGDSVTVIGDRPVVDKTIASLSVSRVKVYYCKVGDSVDME